METVPGSLLTCLSKTLLSYAIRSNACKQWNAMEKAAGKKK